jgi:hypothetical protein
MVELDCGFTLLCLPVHSSGHSAKRDPSSTKSRPMLVDTRTVFLRTC